MMADDRLAAFDAAQSWGDAMKALNEWREKAENTPSEAPDNAVSDFLYSGAPGEGSTPADGPQWRDRGAIIATLTAEVEQLKAENERLRGNTAGLYERAHAAEAGLSRLREVVEGLAVEWEWTPGTVLLPSSAAAAYEQGIADCTEALRALLAVQEPPAATEDTPTEQGEATRRDTFAEVSRAMNRIADLWERDGSDPCRVRITREYANAYRLYADGLGEPTGSKRQEPNNA